MKESIMRMTTAESLDALEGEFTSDDGFFSKLYFRRFEPEAGMRLLAYVKALSLSSDHRTNYRLLWLLWQAQIDLEIASAHEVGGREFTQLQEKLFPEFARIFDAELRLLGQS